MQRFEGPAADLIVSIEYERFFPRVEDSPEGFPCFACFGDVIDVSYVKIPGSDQVSNIAVMLKKILILRDVTISRLQCSVRFPQLRSERGCVGDFLRPVGFHRSKLDGEGLPIRFRLRQSFFKLVLAARTAFKSLRLCSQPLVLLSSLFLQLGNVQIQ